MKKRLEKQYWHVEDLIQAETKIIVKNPENFSESVVLFRNFCYSMDISDKLKIKKKGIRSMRKGTKFSDEHKAKISAALKGKTRSDETKAKISAGNKGKKLSDENKEKLIINSIISGNKAKQVLCITTGEKFSSQNEAARCLFDNTTNSLNISKCCKGKIAHFHGYQFRYI